ncbi:unnamed protein product [marine sediment metagenome]|uniref:Uncharacterized protein n=1 Tax=marine sediment metagenome TaxID=412755 RepID=X1VRQ3_9ZZZZ
MKPAKRNVPHRTHTTPLIFPTLEIFPYHHPEKRRSRIRRGIPPELVRYPTTVFEEVKLPVDAV